MALLLGEEFRRPFSVLVFVQNDVFWLRNETMLYSSVACEAFLIGSGVEEADIERFFFVIGVFRQEDGVGMCLCRVVILTVAGQTAEEHSLILVIPFVDRQKNEPLSYSPSVG